MTVGESVKDAAVIREVPVINDVATAIDDYESFLNKPYQFSDFHIDFKEYKPADIKFENGFELRDDPNYWNDWKEVFADVDNSDHDFAGHFKLFSAGNGTMRNLFLVDGLTGIIYPYDGMMTTGPSKYIFRKDSNLLIEVMDNEYNFLDGTTKDEKIVYIFHVLQKDKKFKSLGYYTYENNSFKLLGDPIYRDNEGVINL